MAKIFVCGDIINQFSTQQFVDEKICAKIKCCDYAIGNLEGVVANHPDGVKIMQQVPCTIKYLKDAGFKLLLLANNHITDYGKEGLQRTLSAIQSEGMEFIGAGFDANDVYAYKTILIGETKFAVINICEAQNGQFVYDNQTFGYAWLGHKSIENLIIEAKKNTDYLLVFVHAGLEHYQLPLRQIRELYKHYCDLGADCVIGSHPHIVQGIEYYGDSLIAYSLGNFFFPRSENADYLSDRENSSYSLVLDFTKNSISYDVVYHQIANLKVSESIPNATTEISSLSVMLDGLNYDNLLSIQTKEAFFKTSYNLYKIALNSADIELPFLSRLKFALKYLFRKHTEQDRKNKFKLLRHLNINESYRFLNEEALSDKTLTNL